MLLGFGWAVVQASRSSLVDPPEDQIDALDESLAREDRALHAALLNWLKRNQSPWLKWVFSENLNNHHGLLQFHTSRNHRTSEYWELANFIASQSKGSFGALHVWDAEDGGARTGHDFSRVFRLWRILDGELTEHDDRLFSGSGSGHAFGGEPGFGV